MFDRRLIQYFDWWLLALTLILGTIGILLIYSAVNAGEQNPLADLYIRQAIWFASGLALMVISFLFSYKRLDRWIPLIYGGCLLLLALVLVPEAGKTIGGSTRWLSMGPVTLQPSEPVKLAVILFLARYYARRLKSDGLVFRDLVPPLFIAGIPFLLITIQPDLGTAGIIALVATSMTIFVKIERRTFYSLAVLVLIALPVGWYMLEDYQRMRIMMLFFPNTDALGAGYHILQSKIAVGSGMLYGKGYLEGTQNILSFLPEQHTDFIFSVIAEEFGFVGSIFMLILYLLLISFGLNIAYVCRDPFGTILAVGITSMIFWQCVINVGMVMGVMPVVGMPMPLLSYGGSALVTVLLGMGLLMNISMRRFTGS
ncbi:MAG: rod shape-determining protein RodA [Desulfobacteraceae bacterium]|nr:rod shape-determining protein RodA [Desulfobacteraceae bacterium]MCF8094036.1 rod shape-determining protein RodA [Desulfobacteraceae bacterium]